MRRPGAALIALNLAGAACFFPSTAVQPALPPTPQTVTALPVTPLVVTPATPDATPTDGPTATPPPLPTPVTTFTSAVASQTTGAVTVVTISRTTRYELVGGTAQELDAYMRTLGPLDSTGNHWFALTEPLFDWTPACTCDGDACRAETVTVTVTVDYTLPAWDPPPGADATLVANWRAFESAVVTHERGHGDLASTCGQWLGEAFAALGPQPSCADLEAALLPASNEVFPRCRAAQRDYENATNHGQNDGVLWPPYLE